MSRSARIVLVLALVSCGADEKSEILREDSRPQIPTSAPAPTTPPTSTAFVVANVPVSLSPQALTQGATTTKPAVRAAVQFQLTEPIPPPVPVRPEPIPGDCDSWAEVFRWYGATDAEVYFFFVSTPWGRRNVISAESMCGLRFRNPDTSDTGICQLNGVHRQWVLAEFGLRIGYANVRPQDDVGEAEASNPEYARACLYLLRGGHDPGSMRGACNWRPPGYCG